MTAGSNEPLPTVPLTRDPGPIAPISLTGERLPLMRPGERILIKVLNMIGDGRALINIRGTNLIAEGLADLPPGTQLAATVKETRPRPVLQLDNAAAGPAGQTQSRTIFLQEQPAATQTTELAATQGGAAKPSGGQSLELVLPDGRVMAGRIDTDIMPGVKAGDRFAAIVQQATAGKMTVSIGGQTLVLESSAQGPLAAGVSQGQIFGATIVRTGGNISVVLEQPVEPNELFAGTTAGERFKATVVERLGDGGTLMYAKGKFFEAELPADVGAGTRLTMSLGVERGQQFLQIVHQGPAVDNQSIRMLEAQVAQFIRLNGLPEYSPAQSMQQMRQQLATLLAGDSATQLPPDLAQAAARLKERLDQMIGQEPVVRQDNIRQIVQDGGNYYESKLTQAAQSGPGDMSAAARNDLKGLLLGLSDALASAGSQAGQSLAGPAAGALTNIEAQQMMNALSQARNGPVWIEVPLGSAAPWTAVGMLIERDRAWFGREQDLSSGRDSQGRPGQQGESKPGHSVLFLLNMERLGRIRIDARVKEKNVQATFYVENDDAQESFSKSLAELAGALEARGYPNATLAVRNRIHVPPDKDRKFNNLARGWPVSMSVVDVRV